MLDGRLAWAALAKVLLAPQSRPGVLHSGQVAGESAGCAG